MLPSLCSFLFADEGWLKGILAEPLRDAYGEDCAKGEYLSDGHCESLDNEALTMCAIVMYAVQAAKRVTRLAQPSGSITPARTARKLVGEGSGFGSNQMFLASTGMEPNVRGTESALSCCA